MEECIPVSDVLGSLKGDNLVLLCSEGCVALVFLRGENLQGQAPCGLNCDVLGTYSHAGTTAACVDGALQRVGEPAAFTASVSRRLRGGGAASPAGGLLQPYRLFPS